MFSAILGKKAGHWFTNASQPDFEWDQSIRRLEDSLTAFIFDTLIAIRGSTIAELLSKASGDNEIAYGWLGKESFLLEFWPSFPHAETRVLPDVVIKDSIQKKCIVVEVKWRGMQAVNQIRGQIEAVRSMYKDYAITMLLLGGYNVQKVTNQIQKEADSRVVISGITWQSIQDCLGCIALQTLAPPEKRALNHLKRGLEWYGIRLFNGIAFPTKEFDKASTLFFTTFNVRSRFARVKTEAWFSDLSQRLTTDKRFCEWRLV